MLMLAALRCLPRLHTATREGRGWTLDPAEQDSWHELGGRTVGLIGFGAVPRRLAPVLQALGCPIVYTTRAPKHDAPGTWMPLDDLLAAADVVSLHVPLAPETTLMLDRDRLGRLKPGSVLINTARGGLIDQQALVEVLEAGPLAAAGLDVFAAEPAPISDRLFTLPNVVTTPHVAWATSGTFARSFAIAAENCRRLRCGEELLYRVR
jgi:phosphoglycerate dehydrogenase-like enzyme